MNITILLIGITFSSRDLIVRTTTFCQFNLSKVHRDHLHELDMKKREIKRGES